MSTPDYQAMWIRKTEEYIAFADAALVAMAGANHQAMVDLLAEYVESICDHLDDDDEQVRLCELLDSAYDRLAMP